ncbi:MAG: DUF1080 domain-containing protein [Planctomycetota bacterium]
MRLICLVAALLASGLSARAAEDTAPAPGLTPEETEQGFVCLFDGTTHDGWQGDTEGYKIENGTLACAPGGNLFTAKEYGDFAFRFEFKMPKMGNNGVGIRTPLKGNPAYVGMEIQILDDNYKEKYPQLQDYQVHGSIYGVVPAKPGHQKPIGEWNCEEILCKGSHVKITLNGVVIVDADLDKIEKTLDGHEHPGLRSEKGYIGFLGHGSRVEFRNIRIKELKEG